MHKSLTFMALCASTLLVTQVWAAVPTPSIVPRSWTLDFQFAQLERVSVTLPGKDKPVVYWYMVLTPVPVSRPYWPSAMV